jgi:predicted helicase
VVPRQIGTAQWQHAFVAENPANDCLVSDRTREAIQVFPLFLYAKKDGKLPTRSDLFESAQISKNGRCENIDTGFRQWFESAYSRTVEPKELFGYVYAVLNARSYRNRYSDFLRREFPRIPFPRVRRDFDNLANLGCELIDAHLMRKVPNSTLGAFKGRGDYEIGKPTYVEAEQSIRINDTQYFAHIPTAVWNFEIGAYKPIEKFLKSRKGRKLTLEEIENVTDVAKIIEFTIGQMECIDLIYQATF